MAFKVFKDKASNVIFVITAIGALITLISYVRPVINYASDLNKLVHQYQQINESMEKIEQHIKDYEEARANKGKSFQSASDRTQKRVKLSMLMKIMVSTGHS